MKKPSLFDYATSELSQDAILCWLLEWARHDEEEYEKYQKLAKELIKSLYCLANPDKHVDKVEKIPRKLKQIEMEVESNYSRTMSIAKELFKDYDPVNKRVDYLASQGKELFGKERVDV